MPLARLENLLKNLNGNILYVDPAQLDSTDSIENRGNSALRPFKTIQRALLEAVRFSYVQGANNDLFDQTTILISPGTHYIDNRPGYYVDGTLFKTYGGTLTTLNELNLQSIMDLNDPTNELYKYNSADGGVIIPRGVSIVASDLRKTKIRPKYVPSPTDELVAPTSIFKLTGACYIYGFSIFDGDPNGNVYSSPLSTFQTPPSYSHHKLTAFEYADGKNKLVKAGVTLDKTDLEMYYYKVAEGFGPNSGIPAIIDWGVSNVPDLYPNIEENRIVGDLGFGSRTIDSIYAGNGVDQISNIVTVTTETDHNLSPNTSILISNIGSTQAQRAEYNGAFTVSQVISPTVFTYRLPNDPLSSIAPTVNSDSVVTTASDTVSSSSPYVFNCSLKSVYGMNGLHADGSKATGFKSIVTAQFTGISLQKDDNAFVLYNSQSGTYNDQSSFDDQFLHQNSRAIFKPNWESFHIKASNDAFVQCVSIFAIGYSKHFVADNGGDQSITNSNSNFGSIALSARGFKDYELEKDNHAFITHIIPPKEVSNIESEVRYLKLDSSKVSNPERLYLKDYTNILNVPPTSVKGFNIGGRNNEQIYINSSGTSYNATISPNYKIEVEISSINNNTITLSENLTVGTPTGINTSQPVRIVSNNGIYPDGIEPDKIYYINKQLTTNTIKLSESESSSLLDEDILNGETINIITINDIGASSGNLKLVSKVSDSTANQIISPIKFDATNGWYISIESNASFLSQLASANDPVCYIKRVIDNRNLDDKLYRARIVIPKESRNASEPSAGFILQRSSLAVSDEYESLSTTLTSVDQARNTNQIIDAWVVNGSPNTAHIITKFPHNLLPGNSVNIYNLKSSNEPNPIGLGTGTGYNGSFVVDGIINDTHFTYPIVVNPGTITSSSTTTNTNWMNVRDCSSSSYRIPPYTIENDGNIPYFTCESVNNEFQLYKLNTIQKYTPGVSDGVYYATLNAFKNTPTVPPFNVSNLRLSQSIENLYPSSDVDNLVSDPRPTKTVASRKLIGKVDINNIENSVTKETISQLFKDFGSGFTISSITKDGSACTVTTDRNHGLKGIGQISVSGGAGSGFVNGTWYDIPLCGGSGEGATAIITVSGGGVISARVSYPGSGYNQGDTLIVKGIPHTTTNGQFINVTVLSIQSLTNKSIQIIGSNNEGNDGFFPIISATKNTITYQNSNGESEVVEQFGQPGVVIVSNNGLRIDSISYSPTTNLSTVNILSADSPHSISVGNKVYFSGIPSQNFSVVSVNSTSSFQVEGDISTSAGSVVYVVGLSPSLRDSNKLNENLSTRQYPFLGEIVTRCSSVTQNTVTVTSSVGFKKSDFIQIDDEIMMITAVNGSGLSVLRGLFNTKQVSHSANSLVKKIKPIAVELRRNSILRASGHTFEYTGFGPGNYSTGMPTNQNRVLSDDEILISQSLSTRGGSVLYSGMNSDGEFYIGRKKFNTLTGEEELLGVPEQESQSDYSDEFTVNNLTIINELDASTATATFNSVITDELTVNNDATIGGDLTVDGNVNISGDLIVDGDIDGSLQYSVFSGDGLSGGQFNNTSNITLSLATPGSLTSSSTNSVYSGGHTHQIVSVPSSAIPPITQDKLSGISGIKHWGVVSSSGGANNGGSGDWTSTRTAQGKYAVTIPGMPDNACVIVSIEDTSPNASVVDEVAIIRERFNGYFTVFVREVDDKNNLRNSPFSFIVMY